MIEHNLALLETFFHSDETLITTATIEKVGVFQPFYVRSIYQNIDLFEQSALFGFCEERFESEACKTPDGFIAAFVDGMGQFGESFCLEHRVTSTESDIGKWVSKDDIHDFVGCHQLTLVEVPRLAIMAARTVVSAPCAVDAGAETRPIDHGVFYDGKDAKHSSRPTPHPPCEGGGR